MFVCVRVSVVVSVCVRVVVDVCVVLVSNKILLVKHTYFCTLIWQSILDYVHLLGGVF